jgi:LytS/YehU family sensor histidine kinase
VLPYRFYEVFTTSQCIGLCILAVSLPFDSLRRRGGAFQLVSLVTVPVGGLAGVMLGGAILRGSPFALLTNEDRQLGVILSSALVFGGAATYWFQSRDELAEQRAQLREQALRHAESERRLAEANLKVLQAQMEPHFLFNTLSNVQGLIETRPGEAARMLANLTAYLRASLQRTRAGATTLGHELELVRAYLEIQSVRMGPRLRWSVDAAPGLLELPFPPLTLQPLVENAVRHGLEHRTEGGEVRVAVRADGDALVLEVADTGIGLHGDAAAGVGLANVRERLRGLYGPEALVEIRPNAPEGLRVSLRVPGARGERRAS